MYFRVRFITVQILQVPEKQSNDSEGQKREEKDQLQVDDNYFITFLSMQC